MKTIALKSNLAKPIRFSLYQKDAPKTCDAFLKSLPKDMRFVHAKISGEEIYAPGGPRLKVPQENASTRLMPGEVGYAPSLKRKSGIENNVALVYGKAVLWDCVNVFAKVLPRDQKRLKELTKKIKKRGAALRFEVADR